MPFSLTAVASGSPSARAGLHPAALELIAERKIAVLGSDSNSDASPSTAKGVESPVHVLAINALGVHAEVWKPLARS